MSFSRLVEIIQRFELYPELKDKRTTEEIVEKMKGDTNLEPVSAEIVDKRTGRASTATIAFTLSYEGKNPKKVQQVANTLTSLFLEENLQVREKQAQETSAFLEGEMGRIKAELAGIDSQIADYKEVHINELPEMLQLNLQTLNNIERNIELASQQLRTLKEKEEYLETQLASITPYKEEDTSRQRLEELKMQLVHLTKRFSEEYPDVKKTRAEIADLEKQLKESGANPSNIKNRPDNPAYISLAAQLASTNSEIESIKRQLEELNLSANEYRNRIAASPRVEEAYNALTLARNTTQAKYDDLMRKHMEARVAQGLEKEQKGERFTLIEPPRLPEKPFKPNRMAIMLIGMVLGVGAGIGLTALREFSDDAVRDGDNLTIMTQFPVLAGIPEIITAKDITRRRTKRFIWAATAVGVMVIGLVVFHFLVMDLDIFWAKLMRKLPI
jgi:polysaccharide chain length determinant protein (PEP-CTERM system associated)